MASKPATEKELTTIDLTPDEAGVLTIVAQYAELPGAKENLEELLKETTPRAREIGRALLDKQSARVRPLYRAIAKKFSDAHDNNVVFGRVLKSTRPPGLWVNRDL